MPPELVAGAVQRAENDHPDLPLFALQQMGGNVTVHLQDPVPFGEHLTVILALDSKWAAELEPSA
jgi:hypothetical protein